MAKRQNLTYVKPYFNDGISNNKGDGAWKEMFNRDEKKKACRNIKRTKIKRKK